MPSPEVKTACAAAAQEIRTRGWSRGKMINDAGAVCCTGALAIALGGVIATDPNWPKVGRPTVPQLQVYNDCQAEILVQLQGLGYVTVPHWNDHSRRTKAEVLAILDGIANP